MSGINTLSPARYRIAEAAERHGLRVWMLRQAVRERRIEFFLVANRYEFTDAAVMSFIENMRKPVAA